tara:strand:+ start:8293 stop:9222 length:930 start_codon:yes stop_codon:yes gene_type:complete
MNYCSFFIKDKALFGSYPNKESFQQLYDNNIRYFVDLTNVKERKDLYDYKSNEITYYNYQINDKKYPENIITFIKFIIQISETIKNLKNNEKIYIHCKGGHGRSGILVACLLCYIYNIKPQEALDKTTKYHSDRLIMRDRWRKIGSPQTYHQKSFVVKLFKNLYFFKAFKKGKTMGFSNFSFHDIYDSKLNVKCSNSECLFHIYKYPDDKKHIDKMLDLHNPLKCKIYADKLDGSTDWDNKKLDIMKYILQLKIQQHSDIKENLMNTGLRNIIYTNKLDSFWGVGVDNKGYNHLGKLWTEIRNEEYMKL